ncbi:hypothetical protein [Rhodanobacter sp. C01]|uniref:hypothetical protein n=1 Tax=Rhodanobacter sp. C01 TaxID=1945856 RepID=UPI000986E046|nr:hypothetical protein [Rhodanobacter sp. C01]OOG49580.1 hypothetical protein B0E50_05570 [Rhodanobacter sp. C01]
MSERNVAEAWAELLQRPLLAARDAPELPPADPEMSLRILKQEHVVPVQEWLCWCPIRISWRRLS